MQRIEVKLHSVNTRSNNLTQYLCKCTGVSRITNGSHRPAATSVQVLGDVDLVSIWTSIEGFSLFKRYAVERPITPAPMTATFTIFFSFRHSCNYSRVLFSMSNYNFTNKNNNIGAADMMTTTAGAC